MSELKTDISRDVAELYDVSVSRANDTSVTTAQAKLYAKIDASVDDDIVDDLIESADLQFESYTGKLLFEGTVTATYYLRNYESVLYLPWLPVVSITSVQNSDNEDVDYELRGDKLWVDAVGEIEVVYTAGLFSSSATGDAKIGILKWITSNYEDRQDVAGMSVYEMPNSSRKHWNKYKTITI